MSVPDSKADIGGIVIGVAVEKTHSAKSGNPCASIEEDSSHQKKSSVIAVPMNDTSKITYKLSDKVEGNFRGSNKWKLGRIYKCNPDKTYHISYDDGDHEEFIAASKLRKFVQASKNSVALVAQLSTTANVAAPATGHGYKEGYIVSANYYDRGTHYQARICFAHADGTYDVIYSNGLTEYRKAESSMHALFATTTWNWDGTYDVVVADGRCYNGYRRENFVVTSGVDGHMVIMVLLLIFIVILIIVEGMMVSWMMDVL
eukprot:gene8050-9596_t